LADVSWTTIHAGIQHPHPPANHFCKENVWTTGAARGLATEAQFHRA
jgi:hypothetical protein